MAGTIGVLWVCFGGATGALAQQEVDLELILAVDASSSVNDAEFDLQMRGIAGALRHPAVQAAVRASGDLGIAVSLVQWADNRNQYVAVDWRWVRDEAGLTALADDIEATPRLMVGQGTAIGGAIAYSVRQMARNGFEGRRKVIDISGDGRTNQGARPDSQRDLAVEEGVSINGLAILNEDPYIDGYYLYNVIGGTGAFVMSATDYEDFSAAMLEKLVKEIAGMPIASLEYDLPHGFDRSRGGAPGPRLARVPAAEPHPGSPASERVFPDGG